MSGSTSTFPLDTIVEVTDEIGGVEYQGSGVLIAPDEVLTASHVVYQAGVGVASNVVVAPGASGVGSPFGTANGTIIHYNPVDDSNDTISATSSESDYAVIHLSSSFTNLGTMTIDPDFSGGAATVSGYPATYRGLQDDVSEFVVQDPGYTLFEGRSLGPGSSGGPVWFTGANGQAEVVGLVSSGSGRLGYDVQLTSADVAQIDAWVAEDDGAAATTTTAAAAPPAGFTNDTVAGADGTVITIAFPTANSAIAASVLGGIGAGTGQLDVSQVGDVTLPAGDGALIDSASGGVTAALTSGQNISVVAGAGGLTVDAGATTGTVVAAGGNTLFYGGAATGAWDIALAAGANTIVAGAGADSIAPGGGANVVFLGAGADCVASAGADTLIGGGGSATVSATGTALVFGGAGTLDFLAGAGASTVVGASAGTTVTGAGGPLLFFGTGPSRYVGGPGTDTILGGSGSLTAQGGGGAALIIGGAGGGNALTTGGGTTTLLGGAAGGDVLTATGSANDVLAAGSGAATLTAAASSGSNSFFAGPGSDVLIGGSGASAMIAGRGDATLTGGSGYTIFGFVDGMGGGVDLITDFNPARDEIALSGFDPNGAADAVRSEAFTGGATILTLVDNTRITLAGITALSPSSFV